VFLTTCLGCSAGDADEGTLPLLPGGAVVPVPLPLLVASLPTPEEVESRGNYRHARRTGNYGCVRAECNGGRDSEGRCAAQQRVQCAIGNGRTMLPSLMLLQAREHGKVAAARRQKTV